jgi:ABC-type nitrate/sulfonate/bicarbonate transport system substrate-binding protein
MNLKRAIGLTVVGLLFGGSVGCSDADSGQAAENGELENVQLILPGPLDIYFPSILVAQKMFWPDFGLEVEDIGTDGSSGVMQQLAAGNGDFGIAGASAVYATEVEGTDVTGLAALSHDDIADLVVLESSDIKSAADLQGAPIGITSSGDGARPIVGSALHSAGVTDFNELIVGTGGPQVAAALNSGDITAYAAAPADVVGVEMNADLPMRSIMPESYKGLTGNVFAVPKSVQEDPAKLDQAIRLLAGYLAAQEWAIDNPEETIKIACEAMPQSCTDQAVADATVEVAISFLSPLKGKPGSFDEERTMATVKAVSGETPLPFSDVFTNEYIDQINEKMGSPAP